MTCKLFEMLKECFQTEVEHPQAPSNPTTIIRPFKMALPEWGVKKLYTPYPYKYDKEHGLCLHWTSGQPDWHPRDFFEWASEVKICTYYIERDGTVWCNHDFNRSGYHEGRGVLSEYMYLKKKLAGIEGAAAGKLEPVLYSGGKPIKFKSWFGKVFDLSEVRYVNKDMGYRFEGYYHVFTKEQEQSFIKMIRWHVEKGMSIDNVVEHSQIAAPFGRKVDCEGALSLPLNRFIDTYCR